MSASAYDVAIVGAGIMGASSAFFLAQRGYSVVLLEADRVGRQASGTNFGNVRRQGRPFSQMPLANRARDVWGRLPELIGDDCEFVARGHLRLALDEEDADRLAAYRDEAVHHGLDMEMLTGNAVRDRFPYLSERVRAGCFAPIDGHANPRLSAPGFARAAQRLGVRIKEMAPVISAARAGEDFIVETGDGQSFRAPALLIAAGAWSAPLTSTFGEPVSYEVKGPQMAVTEPAPYFIGPSIGVASHLPDEGVYFRQVARGNIIMGGPRYGLADANAWRSYVLPDNTLRQFDRTRSLLPVLSKLRVIRVWSGIESYFDDAQPVMGPSPSVPGLYYAFGFSGQGFQLGPGVGEVMAELIATGATSTPLDAFSLARFAGLQS
ncbi:NAD(P)/FAD-dependent oxidoreductase [Pelagibacterium sp.]|uniref:NAD(P)/FAD-dependent oxidoreductase n=1 Tax=Pelagibacterium sp. TaxID=1967288 RepID=UPI003BAAB6BF